MKITVHNILMSIKSRTILPRTTARKHTLFLDSKVTNISCLLPKILMLKHIRNVSAAELKFLFKSHAR
jgi:hypothetical protein